MLVAPLTLSWSWLRVSVSVSVRVRVGVRVRPTTDLKPLLAVRSAQLSPRLFVAEVGLSVHLYATGSE